MRGGETTVENTGILKNGPRSEGRKGEEVVEANKVYFYHFLQSQQLIHKITHGNKQPRFSESWRFFSFSPLILSEEK